MTFVFLEFYREDKHLFLLTSKVIERLTIGLTNEKFIIRHSDQL